MKKQVKPVPMQRMFLLLVWLGLLMLAGATVAAAQEAEPASPEDGPVIRLGRPAEGETFYSGPSSLLYSIPINGWAFSPSYGPSELEIRLEILQAGTVVGSQTVVPDVDGTFIFYAMVNSENFLDPSLQEHDGCFLCHFSTALELPPGPGSLRVTVIDPAGKQSVAERQIITDRSASVDVPVRLVLEGDPRVPLEGVEVSASTRLYMWRTRNALAMVDAGGTGVMQVEALSQAPTHYVFQVEPHIRNGVRFSGIEPVEVTLLPGMAAVPEVILQVRAETGVIHGQVSVPQGANLPKVSVLAFHLPDGECRQVWTAASGEFSFDPLPIGSYLITTDQVTLVDSGFDPRGTVVDLAGSPEAVVNLPLAAQKGLSLDGYVRYAEDQPLPFAWVKAEQQGQVAAVLPENGQFHLIGLLPDPVTLIASAPGYYSYAQVADPGSAVSLDFTLVRRPETRTLPWGEGEIVIPAESGISESSGEFQVDHGWLWGAGGGDPIVLHAAGSTLRVQAGRFALEKVPGSQAWFYLFSGQAELLSGGDAPPIPIHANEMVALGQPEAVLPVAYQPALIRALQASETTRPVEHAWQPSLKAALRDRLAQFGIGMGQAITFVTYMLAFLALFIGPLLVLYGLIRRRRAS